MSYLTNIYKNGVVRVKLIEVRSQDDIEILSF